MTYSVNSTLTKLMRIIMKQAIIFGGAFNPPSRGHVWILSECARIARELGAEIWILPSGERRDKKIGIPRELRLALCAAMVQDAKTSGVEVRILTDELDRTRAVETIDTVTEFAQRYLEYELIWVFGADSYATMQEWRAGNWLLAHLNMIVVTRAGFPVLARPNIRVIKGIHDDLSSTQIREAHIHEKAVSNFVSPRVGALLASGKIRYTNI